MRSGSLVLGALVFGACVSTPPAAQWGGDDRLTVPLSPDGVGTDAWWAAADPCPDGGTLKGDPPPKGLAVRCVDEVGLPTGRSTEWHRNGQVMADGTYVDGARHGVWRHWSSAGDAVETTWEHGQLAVGGDPDGCYVDVTVLDRSTRIGVAGADIGVACGTRGASTLLSEQTDARGHARIGPAEPGQCNLFVLVGGANPVIRQVTLEPGVLPIEILVR